MAQTTDNKASIAYKKVLGKAHTDDNKDIGNEALSSYVQIHSDNVFGETIDTEPSNAVAAGIAQEITSAVFTLDPTANDHAYILSYPAGHSQAGQTIVNAIPVSYGTNYEVSIRLNDTASTVLPVLDARNWVYDYANGVFWQQTPASTPEPAKGDLYAYVGRFVTDTVTDAESTVKISVDDTAADYLFNQLVSGNFVSMSVNNDAGNESITIAVHLTASDVGAVGGTDEKVKVSSDDTASDYLFNQLVSGAFVSMSVNNDAANESITVAVHLTASDVGSITEHSSLLGLSSDHHTQYTMNSGRVGQTLLIDNINEYTANCGVTIEAISFEDNTILPRNTGSALTVRADGTGLLTLGQVGQITIGDGTERDMYPQTTAKVNLGTITNQFNNLYLDGTARVDALRIDEGATLASGTGLAGIVMANSKTATNAIWIPVNYNGTTYYIPGWSTTTP